MSDLRPVSPQTIAAFDDLDSLPLSEPRSVTRSAVRKVQEGWTVRAYCDCGGEWRSGAVSMKFATDERRALHRCSGCGAKAVFTESHPREVIDSTTYTTGAPVWPKMTTQATARD